MADIDKALPNTRTKLEVPGQEQEVDVAEQEQQKGPVEVTPEEDGGATIDFDPSAVNQPGTESHLQTHPCLLYTSPSPRDGLLSRMPSSA